MYIAQRNNAQDWIQHSTQDLKPSANINTHYSLAKSITGCIKFTKRVELWMDFWQLDNIFESPGQNERTHCMENGQLPIGPYSYTTLNWFWEKTWLFCSLGGSFTFFHHSTFFNQGVCINTIHKIPVLSDKIRILLVSFYVRDTGLYCLAWWQILFAATVCKMKNILKQIFPKWNNKIQSVLSKMDTIAGTNTSSLSHQKGVCLK